MFKATEKTVKGQNQQGEPDKSVTQREIQMANQNLTKITELMKLSAAPPEITKQDKKAVRELKKERIQNFDQTKA